MAWFTGAWFAPTSATAPSCALLGAPNAAIGLAGSKHELAMAKYARGHAFPATSYAVFWIAPGGDAAAAR